MSLIALFFLGLLLDHLLIIVYNGSCIFYGRIQSVNIVDISYSVPVCAYFSRLSWCILKISCKAMPVSVMFQSHLCRKRFRHPEHSERANRRATITLCRQAGKYMYARCDARLFSLVYQIINSNNTTGSAYCPVITFIILCAGALLTHYYATFARNILGKWTCEGHSKK